MAISHFTITVGTTPIKIVQAPLGVGLCRAYITNHDNAALFIGDSSVNTSGADWGFTITKDTDYEFEMAAGDALYAISDSSAQVTVLLLNTSK